MNNMKGYECFLDKVHGLIVEAKKQGQENISVRIEDLENAFPELTKSKDEQIRRVIYGWIYTQPDSFFEYGFSKEEMLAWVEKQGKQEDPQVYETEDGEIITYSETDGYKVAAKFHEGDWVVRGDTIAQILDIQEQYYVGIDINGKDFTSSRYLSDDKIHLWTINDAKDGDVLATKDGNPFIFKDCSDADHPNAPVAYCGVNDANNFTISADNHWWEDSNQVCPATREQRVLLFQKMKEAGYKWENNQLEEINGDENFVDLGLPSGTLWAKCNLGAEKETDFGKFFQWGDTQGYEGVDEHQFKWSDYKLGTSWNNMAKYNENDKKLILDNEDDPMFAATNGKFKMPTKEQLQELIDYTDHEWTTIDGVEGMKFINKKDDTKYIFIPAAGFCGFGNHDGVGSWGSVWSASRYESDASYAWLMYFNVGNVGIYSNGRCFGYSVRGVLNK